MGVVYSQTSITDPYYAGPPRRYKVIEVTIKGVPIFEITRTDICIDKHITETMVSPNIYLPINM